MNVILQKAISDLVAEASKEDAVFLFRDADFPFGGKNYTPEEAKEAMMAHADEEIKETFHGDQDAFLNTMRECMYVPCYFINLPTNRRRYKQVDSLNDEEVRYVLEDIKYAALDDPSIAKVKDSLSGLFGTDREFLTAFLRKIHKNWICANPSRHQPRSLRRRDRLAEKLKKSKKSKKLKKGDKDDTR